MIFRVTKNYLLVEVCSNRDNDFLSYEENDEKYSLCKILEVGPDSKDDFKEGQFVVAMKSCIENIDFFYENRKFQFKLLPSNFVMMKTT